MFMKGIYEMFCLRFTQVTGKFVGAELIYKSLYQSVCKKVCLSTTNIFENLFILHLYILQIYFY